MAVIKICGRPKGICTHTDRGKGRNSKLNSFSRKLCGASECLPSASSADLMVEWGILLLAVKYSLQEQCKTKGKLRHT